jgi:hypothetical protein
VKSVTGRKILGAATGLVLVGGVASAVAATQEAAGSSRQAYVADVAKRLNVTPSALTSAMKAAEYDQIDAAVAAGRMTQAQADALKQRVQRGELPSLGRRLGRGAFGAGHVAAQYLGVSQATLRSELQSGKSLAQIASATPGKSVEGLKAAIMAAAKARLDQAVSSGRSTTQREQQRLDRLSSHIDALLQRTEVGRGRGSTMH